MFTRIKPTFPKPTGDGVKDYHALVAKLEEFFRRLDDPNVITIDSGQITATNGIKFPATQNASSDVNTLDDYKEATNWTPVASFATPGTSSFTPTIQVADATKIGREVFATFRYAAAVTVGTGSGNLQITGLPYTPSSDSLFLWDGALVWGGLTPAGSRTQVCCTVLAGSPTILFTASGSASSAAVVQAAEVTGTLVLRGTLRFRV